ELEEETAGPVAGRVDEELASRGGRPLSAEPEEREQGPFEKRLVDLGGVERNAVRSGSSRVCVDDAPRPCGGPPPGASREATADPTDAVAGRAGQRHDVQGESRRNGAQPREKDRSPDGAAERPVEDRAGAQRARSAEEQVEEVRTREGQDLD